MEGSKKRKRDVDLPRITYDAGNRTFDRLFKEDTLDGLRDVVRRKLGLTTSTPIHLAQLRDGKMVDLEDDDDFEAFSSSAYYVSTATVRVAVGNDNIEAVANSTQIPKAVSEDGSPKKAKKNKKDSDAVERTPEHSHKFTTGDPQPLPKNRRLSFHVSAVHQPSVTQSRAAVSPQDNESTHRKALTSGLQPVPSSVAQEEEPTTEERNEEREKEKKERKDKKKKKKREKQKELGTERSSKGDTPVDPEPEKKKRRADNKEPHSKSNTEDAISSEKFAASRKTGTGNGLSDDAPQRTAAKRTRDIAPNNDGISGADKTTSRNPSATRETTLESKDTKKRKKSHNDSLNVAIEAVNVTPETDYANAVEVANDISVTKAAKKSRGKSNAQPPVAPLTSETQTTPEQSRSEELNDSIANPVAIQNIDTQPIEFGDSPKLVAEVKTSKKATKKQIGNSVTTGNMESIKEDARELMKAIVARKAAPQPPPSTQIAVKPVIANVPPPTAVKPAKESSSSSAGTNAAAVVETESISAAVSRRGKATATLPSKAHLSKATKASTMCPICNEEERHIRSKCPIVKKGIRAMQKRIAELEKDDASEEVPGARAELIAEIHTLIEGKRRKPKTTLATTAATEPQEDEGDTPAPAVKLVADAFASSAAVNIVSSLVAGTPNDVQTSTPMRTLPRPPLSAKAILSAHSASTSVKSVLSTKPPPRSQPPPSIQPPPPTQPSLSTETFSSTEPPPSTRPRPAYRPFGFGPPSPPPPSIHLRKQSQKPKAAQFSDAMLFPTSFDLSLANGSFAVSGDISTYTDRDIEELMRGPRLTSKDVLSEDEKMSVDEEELIVLEEDEVDIRGPRKSSQRDHPSSSDEDDEEDDDVSPEHTDSTTTEDILAAFITSALTPSTESTDEEPIEKSFHDLDKTNTSRLSSLENAGDIAALVAIHADVDTPPPAPPTKVIPRKTPDDSESTDSQQDNIPVPIVTQSAEQSDIEETDPIKNVEVPPSPVESIASDNEPVAPKVSTSKKEIVTRTTQKRKPAPKLSQSQPEPGAGEVTPKVDSGRQTRTRKKISELPIPPVPSLRPTRAAAAAAPLPLVTPGTSRLRTRAASQASQAIDEEPTEVAPAKTASKTPARAAKTPLKPISKAAGKLTLQLKTPVKPLSKAAGKPSAASKTTATPGARNTRAKILAADLESDKEDAEMARAEQSLATWDILPNSQSNLSQMESENTMMVDELVSSPVPSGKATSPQQTAAQDPLFIYSETQQSFPYSQYPVNRSTTPASESDDAKEVAAVVNKVSRLSTTFRSLTQIAKEPRLYPTFSQLPANSSQREPFDFFGTNGKDDDDDGDDDETEASNSDDGKVPSHIPDGRMAGTKVKGWK